MKHTNDTQATSQRQQRPAVSILPTGYFARAGGADLSPAERQLIEDFRQMSGESRAAMLRLFPMAAARDRAARIATTTLKLHLVQGGAA